MISVSVKRKIQIPALMLVSLILVSGITELSAQARNLRPVEYNKEQLVEMAVVGSIAQARLGASYRIGADGSLAIVPATGSITYNFRTGDNAVNLAGDHVEPAVTLYNSNDRTGAESRGFNILSCIGNPVRVLSGDAKGEVGVVIGKHGGSEHVMVDFKNPEVMRLMTPGDRMQVYAWGTGMKLLNTVDVLAMNVSPQLIDALTSAGMGVTPEGKLHIGVALTVPAKVMGSGLGRDNVYSGDYDIQLFDEVVVEKYGLDRLRFGDIVAILDADNSFGRIFKTGAVTIGVVTHSNSIVAGHGPGVTTLFTSTSGNIEYHITDRANLLYLLLQ